MGLFDRLERGLERAVKAPFAKAFRSEVQPVEIASALRGAMDDRAAILGPGRTIVPNQFVIELSDTDYERLSSYSEALTDELVATAEEHADSQRYTTGGRVVVQLRREDDLETGVFRLRPSTVKDARSRVVPSAAHRPPPAAPAPRAVPAPPTRDGSQHGPGEDQQTRAFAPPPSEHRTEPRRGPLPWLDIDGQRHQLSGAITVLGRDGSADVILDDPGISRRHTEIRVTTDGPHLLSSIRDLGSTNGTFVNGDRIHTRRLVDGDRITIGRTSLVFRLGSHR